MMREWAPSSTLSYHKVTGGEMLRGWQALWCAPPAHR